MYSSQEGTAMKESPTSKKWQAQLSSGFDALLGFASVELDRSKRKSTDDGIKSEPGDTGYNNTKTKDKGSHGRENVSTSRSDSRDSGLGRDVEGSNRESPKCGRIGEIMNEGKSHREASSPKNLSRSSSTESRSSRSSKKQREHLSRSATSESLSPLRHRSRSRSRSPPPLGDKSSDDKYYEKLLKKKFYGPKAGGGGGSGKREEQSSTYTHGSQFRPKGKDWKKNMPLTERSPERGSSTGEGKESSQPQQQGNGTNNSSSSEGLGKASSSSENPVKTKSSSPPSRPQSSGSHSSSAFQSTAASSHGGRETSSPLSRSRGSLHTPSPNSSHNRPPSTSLSGIVPLSTTPLSRSSPGGGPPSRAGSDSHFPVQGHSPFARGTPHPAIATPLLPGLLPFRYQDMDATRLAALGYDGAARIPFFGHPPGFGLVPPVLRPPLIGDLGAARQALLGEAAARSGEVPRHSFGGEPQMFNPLAPRHGKDPLWSD